MEFPASEFVFDRDRAYEAVVADFKRSHDLYWADVEMVLVRWPNLEDAVRTAAFLVSPAMPLEARDGCKRRLLTEAMYQGMLASARESHEDSYRSFLTEFGRVIARGLAGRSVYGVIENPESHRWELRTDHLCQWASGFERIVVLDAAQRLTPYREAAAALVFFGRVLTVHDLALWLEQSQQLQQEDPQPQLDLVFDDRMPGRI